MANFFLTAIKTDKVSLAAIRGDVGFGLTLRAAFWARTLPRFSSLEGMRALPTASDQKKPEAVMVHGSEVGYVLGSYYDGTVVGIDTPPAVIPPRSTVFVSLNSYTDQLERMDGAEVVSLLNRFNRAADDRRGPGFFSPALCPVFRNRTRSDFGLCIVKYWPLRSEDADQVLREEGPAGGWGIGMKRGYQSPRVA